MLTLAELLELLSRWADLSDQEVTDLNDGVAAWLAEATDVEEIGQLSDAIMAASDAILDDGVRDDESLEAMTWMAEISEAASTRSQEITDAEAARDQTAQDLAERIRATRGEGEGEPGDGDGGDGGEPGEGEPGEPAEGEGEEGAEGAPAEGEPAEGAEAGQEAEPVAAAAGRVAPGRARGNRPSGARGRPAQRAAALVAVAGVPDFASGARLDTREARARAFAGTLEAMANMALRPGMRVPVARARAEYPDEAFLDSNARGNEAKLERVMSPEALAAAGGICAPAVPRYDLPQIATEDRPVRAALTRFGADRGGVILPDLLGMGDVEDSVTLWTSANDANPTSPTTKPCLRVDCGGDTTVAIDAIYRCLEFGNFNARTWPERVDRIMSLAAAAHARFAETRLLTRIGALSKQVSYGPVLGTGRDVLTGLDLAASGLRSRERTAENFPLRFMAPFWLRAQIRSDLARELPGAAQERLALADAQIDQFFSVRNINVTWFLDGETGQVFGAQGNGTLVPWPATVVTYLYPEGKFLFLDGGELNFGLVRDSTTNATNDFQMAVETFENVASYGAGDALRLSFAVCPDGSTAGTRDLDCPDSAAS